MNLFHGAAKLFTGMGIFGDGNGDISRVADAVLHDAMAVVDMNPRSALRARNTFYKSAALGAGCAGMIWHLSGRIDARITTHNRKKLQAVVEGWVDGSPVSSEDVTLLECMPDVARALAELSEKCDVPAFRILTAACVDAAHACLRAGDWCVEHGEDAPVCLVTLCKHHINVANALRSLIESLGLPTDDISAEEGINDAQRRDILRILCGAWLPIVEPLRTAAFDILAAFEGMCVNFVAVFMYGLSSGHVSLGSKSSFDSRYASGTVDRDMLLRLADERFSYKPL